ncbi:DNA-binding transcriptional LysR family regulator [Paenibacillus rhizosphaerae]|uniref:DNA-binding transcriptional LysR family regulator n=1 Tax=Paenibacillus rhizosphaerae TaxID=297318 RepID=A0A839U346_9BACL|nr:LysR family transcriptional regulator [Paenibacillus rhizosphaerae]MBB3131869.1 DNA-binding transcriptional LysR family regulator [Paenibacillus rhizosphaerae]
MDLKAVRTFHRIVALCGFNRAAEELNYAQSTVTMQIQKLESELGVRLIERGKTFQLTEAGRLFHEQSAHIVKEVERLQGTMKELLSGEAGHLRLGVVEPIASYRLPEILASFLRDYPNIRVSVTIASSPQLNEQVLRGELDMAICSPPQLGAGLYYEPLLTENFVVLMPEDHPLASRELVMPADLRGHRLLITQADCPYRRKLEMIMQEPGGPPMDTMEIGSMAALKFYVQSGLGAALVPLIVLQPAPAGTVIRPFKGNAVNITCGMVCRSAEYPPRLAASRLYEALKRELPQAGAGESSEAVRRNA